MANKKTLDDLILEVLNEVVGIPVKFDTESPDKATSYGPPPGSMETKIEKKNAQKAIASLSRSSEPLDKIDLSDIRVYLNNIIFGKRETSKLQLNAVLLVLKKIIEDQGKERIKRSWDATMRLLSGQYKNRIPEGVKPLTYVIYPDKKSSPTDYKNNLASLVFDPKPAKTAQNVDPDAEDPESIERSGLFNINLASHGSDLGQFPASFNNAVKIVLKDENNFYERLKQITDFSNLMFEGQTLNEESIQKLMAKSILMDYFNSMVTELDERIGAYQFESFLACLAGGKVEGATTTSDSGQMGAVDFVFAGGEKGSCKYYSNYNSISQAASGFTPGEYVHYIAAIKNKEQASEQGSKKKIVSIDIYYYKVLIYETQKFLKMSVYSPAGSRLHRSPITIGDSQTIAMQSKTEKSESEKIKVPLNKKEYYSERTKVGTFKILGSKDKSYREFVINQAQKLNDVFGNALEKLSKVSKNSERLNDNLQEYSTTGNAKSADDSLDNLATLEETTLELLKYLSDEGQNYDKPSNLDTPTKLSENKSLKKLDKLIERVILEHINK